MSDKGVQVETLDQRRIIVPQGPLTVPETRTAADFIKATADEGYVLKAVAARQKDIGNQRDPHVVTEAIVMTFQKP